MGKLPLSVFLNFLLTFIFVIPVSAQDVIITNARVLDAGTDIESGYIEIRGGRIVSVSGGSPPAGSSIPRIDAEGMTAMPGFIDGHRHIMEGDSEQWLRDEAADRLQEYLDAGFTTLMSGGGPVPGIMELKRRVESGDLQGPRIVSSGRADPGNLANEREARERVRFIANAGVEIVKARLDDGGQDLLRVVIDEASRHDLEVMVHAVTVPLTLDAVAAGAGKLVHTPTRSLIEETAEATQTVAGADIPMTSTLGIWVPIYGESNDPLWRDRTPFPSEAYPRAGVGPVNGRRLFDAGLTYAFGTDTRFLPRDSLAHELIPLRLVFSPRDIIRIMGPNSAEFVDRSEEIGTLEAGKLADIVLIDGDPLDNVYNLVNVMLVLKGGEIVADHRQ